MNKKFIIVLTIGLINNAVDGMEIIKKQKNTFKTWGLNQLKKYKQTKLLKKIAFDKLDKRIQGKILKACEDPEFAATALNHSILYKRHTAIDSIVTRLGVNNFEIANSGITYYLRQERCEKIIPILERYRRHQSEDFKLIRNALYRAILLGKGELVDKIIESYLKTTNNTVIPLFDMVLDTKTGFTPFLVAVGAGEVGIMERLLYASNPSSFDVEQNSKVNEIINAQDIQGNTPLMIAIRLIKHEPEVGLKVFNSLLKFHPKINIRNNNNENAITFVNQIQDHELKQRVLKRLTNEFVHETPSLSRGTSVNWNAFENSSPGTYQSRISSPCFSPAA